MSGGSGMRSAWFVFLGCSVAAAWGQAAKIAPGDWPDYNRDLAGTRYSPLREINIKNVASLAPAWSFTLASPKAEQRPDSSPFAAGGGGGRGARGISSEATPIVVHGVMYVPAGSR